MDRPFPVRYSADEAAGCLACRLLFAADAGADAALAVDSAMQRFLELANAGALAGADVSPAECGIGSLRLRRIDGGVMATFTDVRIDARSLSILVNMAHALHAKVLPLREVQVAWEAIARIADPRALAFPPAQASPPFSWVQDDDLGGVFDIVIDFGSAQDARGLWLATARTAAWMMAVASGAYGDDASPPQVQAIDFATEPMTWSQESLVWYFDRFASGSQALDGLLNVLVRLDGDGVAVAAVELSE